MVRLKDIQFAFDVVVKGGPGHKWGVMKIRTADPSGGGVKDG